MNNRFGISRLLRAVKRRVETWNQSRLRTHETAAAGARGRNQLVIADMDWYGYANFDLASVVRETPELSARVWVQKIPRATIFDSRRQPGRVRRVWKGNGNLRDAGYRGFRLWELCKVSIAKEFGMSLGGDPDGREREVVEQFYSWACSCIDGVEQALDSLEPYAVVVFQGGLFDSRCVVECAARRNIRTIAVETSFIGDHAFVDGSTGFIVNRHRLALRGSMLWEAAGLGQDLDPVEVLKEGLGKKKGHHRTGGVELGSLDLPAEKRLILVLGQVAADASIVLDSELYRSSAELIADVLLEAASHPDWHVVARLHPKESWHRDTRGMPEGPGEFLWDNTLQELQKLGVTGHPSLTVVTGPGISTYDLIQIADLGVTINSQAGLEMALFGKPIITCGRCFYARNGFTWDVGRRELLGATLRSAIEHGLSVEEESMLRDYCRYLFGHFLLPTDSKMASRCVSRLREILYLPPPE